MKKTKLAFIAVCLSLSICFTAFAPCIKGVNAYFESFTIHADGRTYKIYPPQLYYGLNGLDFLDKEGVIQRIIADSLVAPVNATILFHPDEKELFSFTSEKKGRVINEKKLRVKIEQALLSGKTEIFIKSEPISALTTLSMLKKQTNLTTFNHFFNKSYQHCVKKNS